MIRVSFQFGVGGGRFIILQTHLEMSTSRDSYFFTHACAYRIEIFKNIEIIHELLSNVSVKSLPAMC